MGDSRIKDISALLSSFFDKDRLQRGERVSDFFASWESFVGPRLAAHSRVADVDKGFLVIEAEHPGWIQLLQLRQSGILESVARRYPELGLRGIVFRLAGEKARPPAAPAKAVAEVEEAPPSALELDAQARALEEIADPEFKALMASLKTTMQGKG
jgi:hypothetical protein